MKAIYNAISMILLIGLVFYRAMVFMIMYNWFLVEFFNAPILNYWLSFAVIMTLGVILGSRVSMSELHYKKENIDDEEEFVYNISNYIFKFLALNITMFIGWIIHLNL